MKIFILLPRVPYPLEKGDKLRAFNQIKYLSDCNEIHLCALNDTAIHPGAYQALKPYCKSIHFFKLPLFSRLTSLVKVLFNGKPFQVGYFYNKSIKLKIDKIIQDIKPDRIYCQLIRVAEYVKDQKIKKTIDYQDVFSKGVERRIPTAPLYLKQLLKIEYRRLVKYETTVFDIFENKTIISVPDRNLIEHSRNNEIEIIPNGVDADYYKPVESTKEYDLLFTGNMGYPPNINSVEFLVHSIMPLVLKDFPQLKVCIAGAKPSQSVLNLKRPNIIVTGWVEDMREYYSRAKIFIAPMQIGTGLQNKLLEAMAMKLPCITSGLANNALNATEGKEILTGNTPEEYAQQIISLLKDNQRSKILGEEGYNFVMKNYNWKVINTKLNAVICS
jgi:sugar transferase (PEP-CTERM/EpsH1 system associated)